MASPRWGPQNGFTMRPDLLSTNPGDTVFVASPRGWNTSHAAPWAVTRKTKGGQLIIERNGSELRVTATGTIIGESKYYGRQIVTAERAAEMNADLREQELWRELRGAINALDKAASRQDDDALDEAMTAVASAIEARRAATGTGAVHESAVPQGDAQ